MLDYDAYKRARAEYEIRAAVLKEEEEKWEKAMLDLAMACKERGFLPMVLGDGDYGFKERYGIGGFYPEPHMEENSIYFDEHITRDGGMEAIVSMTGWEDSGKASGFMSVRLGDLLCDDCAGYLIGLYEEDKAGKKK